MQAGRRQRSGDERSVRRADLGDAGDAEKRLAAGGLEIAPQRVGAAQQRHIGRMLEIAEPDDPRCAMRGAESMARFETVDADDALASASELVDGGAAHRAEPDHHDIERRHRSAS